jgi:hypothetical protein
VNPEPGEIGGDAGSRAEIHDIEAEVRGWASQPDAAVRRQLGDRHPDGGRREDHVRALRRERLEEDIEPEVLKGVHRVGPQRDRRAGEHIARIDRDDLLRLREIVAGGGEAVGGGVQRGGVAEEPADGVVQRRRERAGRRVEISGQRTGHPRPVREAIQTEDQVQPAVRVGGERPQQRIPVALVLARGQTRAEEEVEDRRLVDRAQREGPLVVIVVLAGDRAVARSLTVVSFPRGLGRRSLPGAQASLQTVEEGLPRRAMAVGRPPADVGEPAQLLQRGVRRFEPRGRDCPGTEPEPSLDAVDEPPAADERPLHRRFVLAVRRGVVRRGRRCRGSARFAQLAGPHPTTSARSRARLLWHGDPPLLRHYLRRRGFRPLLKPGPFLTRCQ